MKHGKPIKSGAVAVMGCYASDRLDLKDPYCLSCPYVCGCRVSNGHKVPLFRNVFMRSLILSGGFTRLQIRSLMRRNYSKDTYKIARKIMSKVKILLGRYYRVFIPHTTKQLVHVQERGAFRQKFSWLPDPISYQAMVYLISGAPTRRIVYMTSSLIPLIVNGAWETNEHIVCDPGEIMPYVISAHSEKSNVRDVLSDVEKWREFFGDDGSFLGIQPVVQHLRACKPLEVLSYLRSISAPGSPYCRYLGGSQTLDGKTLQPAFERSAPDLGFIYDALGKQSVRVRTEWRGLFNDCNHIGMFVWDLTCGFGCGEFGFSAYREMAKFLVRDMPLYPTFVEMVEQLNLKRAPKTIVLRDVVRSDTEYNRLATLVASLNRPVVEWRRFERENGEHEVLVFLYQRKPKE